MAMHEESPSQHPRADVLDLGREVHVVVDLPGTRKEDIKLDLRGGRLDIEAKPTAATEQPKGQYTQHERSNAPFKRELDLPADVSAGKAEARFNNGVLEVVIPKGGEAETRGMRSESGINIEDTDQST